MPTSISKVAGDSDVLAGVLDALDVGLVYVSVATSPWAGLSPSPWDSEIWAGSGAFLAHGWQRPGPLNQAALSKIRLRCRLSRLCGSL